MARKTFDIFVQKDWLPFKLLLNMSLICNYLKEQKKYKPSHNELNYFLEHHPLWDFSLFFS